MLKPRFSDDRASSRPLSIALATGPTEGELARVEEWVREQARLERAARRAACEQAPRLAVAVRQIAGW